MDVAPLFKFERFTGINNVDKSYRLANYMDRAGRRFSEMAELQNVDIDNQMAVSTRPGSDLKLSGTDMHSLWSDGETCLFVDLDKLYRLEIGYASTELLSGLTLGSRMSYAPWHTKIYLTNGNYIGYYQNQSVAELTDPEITYKLPLPAGQRIAYYRGRLYVAKNNVLYISDAMCDHYDIRNGYRAFEGDITMLIAVDKGLYVSDGKTWFVPGVEPEEFQKMSVLDYDAIPYTDRVVNGNIIGDGAEGNLAIWVSTKGICLGDNSGVVKNLTKDRYAMSTHGAGGAAIRSLDGVNHLIATLM